MRKKNKASSFFVQYIAFPLASLVVFMIVLIGTHGGAEDVADVVPKEVAQVISKESLKTLSPEVIEEKDLTINKDLQEYISHTACRYKVDFATVVIMDAHTGDILALYGTDEKGTDSSLCLNAYLAASLFKVVTATAAIDYGGITGDSVFTYNGRAHTLYKEQLVSKKNRWTRKVTLKKAFASSNNVVFAKIGSQHLGEGPLLLAVLKMGFWKSPLDDCECTPSTIFMPESEYNLAELASGFNRRTRISPVHAAQIVSAMINEGAMVTPRITNNRSTEYINAMSTDAAKEIKCMMAQTIRSGTVSKTFRSSRRDRVLKHLCLGAKSGSINGNDPEGRRNWFVGFAQHRSTGEAIAVACLIIRDDYYRIEADTLAKKIIRHYFSKPVEVASKS